ncbi:hypothetical protein AVEN_199640-1 [Araneus ventricosus]|uniref:Uncharacterized protein n=1 Tax=Araneus ventricosus TaxID=182803 RepID=A0A4Y2DF01_ARAVE|nr:hypothetical protein AVEN_199640-1 [Araneus ventricosus]
MEIFIEIYTELFQLHPNIRSTGIEAGLISVDGVEEIRRRRAKPDRDRTPPHAPVPDAITAPACDSSLSAYRHQWGNAASSGPFSGAGTYGSYC